MKYEQLNLFEWFVELARSAHWNANVARTMAILRDDFASFIILVAAVSYFSKAYSTTGKIL